LSHHKACAQQYTHVFTLIQVPKVYAQSWEIDEANFWRQDALPVSKSTIWWQPVCVTIAVCLPDWYEASLHTL